MLSRVSFTAAAHLDHVQVFPLCRCMQEGETFVVLTGCICMEHVQEVLETVQLPFLGSKVHRICACERRGKGKGGEERGGEGRGGVPCALIKYVLLHVPCIQGMNAYTSPFTSGEENANHLQTNYPHKYECHYTYSSFIR